MKTYILSLLLMISFSASISFAETRCAETPGDVNLLLNNLGIDSKWSGFIQGLWSKKVNGQGFNILVHKNSYVIAIKNKFLGTRDAQFLQICESSGKSDFEVRGFLFGKDRALKIVLNELNLKISGGGFGINGRYVKREKSTEQIRREFADLLQNLH